MLIDVLLFVAYLLQCYAVTAISVVLAVGITTVFTIIKEKL
jgi:hypothetical protein